MTEVVLIAAAYLAGSLPFGYWLVRIFRGADIRTLGSKNTGATNVWRNFGWRFGVATLLLDVAKGALPALAALHWSGPLTASIAGHRRDARPRLPGAARLRRRQGRRDRRGRRARPLPGRRRPGGAGLGDHVLHIALRLRGVAGGRRRRS